MIRIGLLFHDVSVVHPESAPGGWRADRASRGGSRGPAVEAAASAPRLRHRLCRSARVAPGSGRMVTRTAAGSRSDPPGWSALPPQAGRVSRGGSRGRSSQAGVYGGPCRHLGRDGPGRDVHPCDSGCLPGAGLSAHPRDTVPPGDHAAGARGDGSPSTRRQHRHDCTGGGGPGGYRARCTGARPAPGRRAAERNLSGGPTASIEIGHSQGRRGSQTPAPNRRRTRSVLPTGSGAGRQNHARELAVPDGRGRSPPGVQGARRSGGRSSDAKGDTPSELSSRLMSWRVFVRHRRIALRL